MISFELSEEQKLIQDTTRKFAAERLWEAIRRTEADRALPAAVVAEAHELGLPAVAVPEEAGGQGLGLVAACLVEEQLAWGDAAACYALGGPGALGPFALELASEGQRRDLLARFTAADAAGRRGAVAWSEAFPSDRPGLKTTARRDAQGYVIDGDKAFVVNGGIADRTIVIAQLDPERGWDGLAAFVVPGDAAGLSAGPRVALVGLDAAHVATLRLDGVRVPEEARLDGGGDLGGALVRAFARQSLLVAARALGVAGRALELVHAYVSERKAFGKPIAHFQAVAFTVADRLMDVESARWMIWQAAAGWDARGEPDLALVAGAAAHALESAIRGGDDGVQLFGGAGFIRDYAIEKLFRDARQLALMAPTVETLDQIAAGAELGLPRDLGAMLPTPDIQPICT